MEMWRSSSEERNYGTMVADMKEGSVSEDWKTSLNYPIYKKGDKEGVKKIWKDDLNKGKQKFL